MITDEFAHIRRSARESIQGRVVLSVMRTGEQAWTHSRVRRSIVGIGEQLSAATPVARVRAAAIVVAVAALINIVGRLPMPKYTAPGYPVALVALVAVIAAAVALAPAAFTAAATESVILRRLPRRRDRQNRPE
jgi:fatty acid desaturase